MQELIRTNDAIGTVVSLVHEKEYENILVVTGIHVDSTIITNLQASLNSKIGHHVVEEGLPSVSNIALLCKDLPSIPDLMIAIGGGRILDTAKLMIHAGLTERPFFIAIPTTAGSGSESTPFAVSYSGLKKISISDVKILPDLAILDPGMLSSLSQYQRAVSGMDALTQSIESIWNIHATKASSDFASESASLVLKNLEPFVNTNDVSLAEKIQWAAYLSGKAIAITRTTGCHALSYYLTTKHGIPHGQAVGIFLPLFFIYNEQMRSKAVNDLDASMKKIGSLLGTDTAFDAAAMIKDLMHRIHLATRFSELNIQIDVDALLDSVNEERFSNHPVAFDREVLKEMITQYLV